MYRLLRVGQRIELLLDAAGVRRRVSPPPLYKRRTLAGYARRFRVDAFVETGTYLGDTAFELAGVVPRVITIEIDRVLFGRAAERLARFPHVTVLHGDSSRVLPRVLERLAVPALFWLDGHFCGGITGGEGRAAPVVRELDAILERWLDGHVVLVDDADCFVGRDGYPALDELERLVTTRRPELRLEVERNIVRIHA